MQTSNQGADRADRRIKKSLVKVARARELRFPPRAISRKFLEHCAPQAIDFSLLSATLCALRARVCGHSTRAGDAVPVMQVEEAYAKGVILRAADEGASCHALPHDSHAVIKACGSGNVREMAKLVFEAIDSDGDAVVRQHDVRGFVKNVLQLSATLLQGQLQSDARETGLGLAGVITLNAVSDTLHSLEKHFVADLVREVFASCACDREITRERWLKAAASETIVRALVTPSLAANAWRLVLLSNATPDAVQRLQQSPKGLASIFYQDNE